MCRFIFGLSLLAGLYSNAFSEEPKLVQKTETEKRYRLDVKEFLAIYDHNEAAGDKTYKDMLIAGTAWVVDVKKVGPGEIYAVNLTNVTMSETIKAKKIPKTFRLELVKTQNDTAAKLQLYDLIVFKGTIKGKEAIGSGEIVDHKDSSESRKLAKEYLEFLK